MTSASTERSVRTVIQGVLGLAATLAVAVPFLHLPAGPIAADGAVVVGVAASIAKAWAALEDAGVIPAWLRSAPSPVIEDPAVPLGDPVDN